MLFEARPEGTGDTHFRIIVLDNTIHIFCVGFPVLALNSKNIATLFRDKIDGSSIRLAFYHLRESRRFLFVWFLLDEFVTALFPFKGTKKSNHCKHLLVTTIITCFENVLKMF